MFVFERNPRAKIHKNMRVAFKMQLNPGQEAEYQRRHDEIWPELAELLQQTGIRNYSIFLDSSKTVLFTKRR